MLTLLPKRGRVYAKKEIQVNNRGIELRRAERYQLSAPVRFYWSTKEDTLQSGGGVLRDIHSNGAYVLSNTAPPVGARVQLEIILPDLQGDAPGMQLFGEGYVLRNDPPSHRLGAMVEGGFAALAQMYPNVSVTRGAESEQVGSVFSTHVRLVQKA
jgi:hypothetical protein